MGAKKFFANMTRFFREAWAELKKVAWPNRRELTVYTTVVFASIVLVSVVVWVIDVASSSAFSWLLRLTTK